MDIFSERLKYLRKENKLTQAEIAKFLGISTRTYQDYEAGKFKPTHENLMKLAGLFNVTVDHLLGGGKHPTIEAVVHDSLEKRLLIAFSKLTEDRKQVVLSLVEMF